MGMGMGTELGWGQEQWGQVLDHVQLSIVESTKNESRSVLVFFFLFITMRLGQVAHIHFTTVKCFSLNSIIVFFFSVVICDF